MITKIKKRDGREVAFNIEKIAQAIFKAAESVGGSDYSEAIALAEKVAKTVDAECAGKVPTVEQIQDTVEKVLIESGHARTAKSYILYRAERNRIREMNTRLMKIYEDLTKVTRQDMVNFEKTTMANKPLRYIILGDEKQLDMEALGKIGPIKRLTTEEVFGY